MDSREHFSFILIRVFNITSSTRQLYRHETVYHSRNENPQQKYYFLANKSFFPCTLYTIMPIVVVAGGLGDMGRLITEAIHKTGKYEVYVMSRSVSANRSDEVKYTIQSSFVSLAGPGPRFPNLRNTFH